MAVSTQTSRIFAAGTESYDAPIQDCPNCGTRVDVTRFEPLQTVTCPGCNGSFNVKGSIDRFNLESIAGKGGTGLVYQAFDPHLGRKVALKVVRPDKAANEDVLQQMAAEAGITASINHPNVVRVYSAAKVTGRFFIAMEIINGGTLDDLMTKKGRLPEAYVLDIAIQVASGLQAAQNAGLLHRDIKPGNILFADAKTAKVVDFGLATVEQHNAGTNEVWGTPYYMPPERLQGQAEDFRADIYALGATLFHAMAGRPPFEAKDAAQVAMKRLHASAPSVLTYAPNISNTTAFVLKKMLERDPAARFQSYDELIESLQFARNELSTKPAASAARVVVDNAQQGRSAMWVTVAALGILVVAGVGGFMVLSKSKTPDPSLDGAAHSIAADASTAKPAPPKIANPDAPAPGVYYVINRESNKVLDCFNNVLENSAPVGVFPKSSTALNQRWIIRVEPDGSSRLLTFHSYKALDVRNGSTDDKAAITAWNPNDTAPQRWRFRQVEPGWCAIFSEVSKKALTVVPGGEEGGAAIAQRDYSGAPDQQWKVELAGPLPPETDGIDPIVNPKHLTMPPVNVRTLMGPVHPRYVPLDISKVVDADSRRGLFGNADDMSGAVQPLLRGMIEVNNVPFDIIDPAKNPKGKDQIVLRGTQGLSGTYPNKVEIAGPKVPLSRLHVVGGHAGWGYPFNNGTRYGALIAKVVIHCEGGAQEEIFLRNGVEYSDHVTSPDLTGAALIPGFASGKNQLRYFHKAITSRGKVEKIVIESFSNQMAPAFCALTVEKR